MLKQLNKNLFSDFSVKKVELGEVEGVLMNSEDFEKLVEKQKEEIKEELITFEKEYEDKKNEFFSRAIPFFREWLVESDTNNSFNPSFIQSELFDTEVNDISYLPFKKKLPGKLEEFTTKFNALRLEWKESLMSDNDFLSPYDLILSLFNKYTVDSKKSIVYIHKEKVFSSENRNFSLYFFKKFLQENTPKKYYNLKIYDEKRNSFLYWFNEEADRMIFMKENFPDIQLLKATNRLLNF